ncbi:Two-component sensor histidine kinase, contains HisKA and HATPase domains [Devosia sp. YR412]|nr:Two-component sensor histidine kinase, contains HisKA and HATPase domains [Devosia sp. YR412]
MSSMSAPSLNFLAGGGEMGEIIRATDWSGSPLGTPETWPGSLRTLVQVMLMSGQPMFIAWGPERIMLYNDGYAPMCANRHPWALGKPFAEVWADIIDAVGPIMDAAYAGIPTYMDDIEFLMTRHGKQVETHFSFGYTPVHDHEDRVAGMFCTALEITSEVAEAKARKADAERLREMFEQAPSAIAVLRGRDYVFEVANSAYQRLVAKSDFLGRPAADVIPDLLEQGFSDLLDRVYETGEPFIGAGVPITVTDTETGTTIDYMMDFVYQPMRDADGEIDAIFVEVADATERHKAEKMQAILNEELAHRIKNQMAVVQAIVSQTLRNAADVRSARQLINGRLVALSSAHDLLVRGKGERASVRKLIETAMEPYGRGDGRQINLTGTEIEVGPKAALSLALILHELATNAVKYGALSVPEGHLDIAWGTSVDEESTTFDLTWTESGGPSVDEPSAPGFGTRLLRGGITGVESRVELDYSPGGFTFVLSTPLADIVIS